MAGAAGMGAAAATEIASMSIGIRPAVSVAAFRAAGNAAGSQGGTAAGSSFLTHMQQALSLGIDVSKLGTDTAMAFTNSVQKALSGQVVSLAGVFDVGNNIFAPLEKSLGDLISKTPIIGEELKKVYQTTGAIGEVSMQWLATISEVGNKWQEITRNIAGQTLNFGAVDGLTQSVQNLYAAGDILREGDIPNSIGEIHSRLGLAGKELEDFALRYSQANILLGTTLNLDNVTGVMNAFGVSAGDAADTLTQLVNISRDTGADSTQLFNTLKQLGPSFQQLGYTVPQMGEIFAQFSKYNVPIDRLSFAFSGMIGKVEEAVAKGRFENLSDGFNKIIESAQTLMDAGRPDSSRNVLDYWFGDKGGGYMFDALRNEIMLTAEQMDALTNAGVDPKYLQPLSEGIDKTRTLTDSLAAMQRQLLSAFRPVGLSLNEALGSMSGNLSDWLATHQADITKWAFDTTEKALEVFSKVIGGFGNVLNLMAGPLEFVKDTFTGISRLAVEAMRISAEMLGKDSVAESAKQLSSDLTKLMEYDISNPIGEMGKTFGEFSQNAKDLIPAIEGARGEPTYAAGLRDASKYQNTTSGQIESALGATADGKLQWLVSLPESQQAIAERLADLGVTITTVNGVITGVQATNVDQAKALQKLFENLSSGKALQTPVTVDGTTIVPEDPSVAKRPLKGIAESSKDWNVAPSAYMPQVDAGDWLPQRVRPAAWTVESDGSLVIPAAVTVDKSRARLQEPGDLMEAMGVPVDFTGTDGLSAPVGFNIEDASRLLPHDTMDAMGIPTDFQGKDGLEAPTLLKVKDEDSKTPKEVMDGMGIPISWQGTDGVIVPASYQANGGMGLPGGGYGGATPGPGGGGFGSGPGQLLDEDGVKSSAASVAGFNAIIANFGSQLKNYVGGGRLNDTKPNTHDVGLSIDVPIGPDQKESLGDTMLAWLVQNGKGLNMEAAIWRDKGYHPDGDMNPDFNVEANTHQDHIDVKFNNATPGPMAAALAAGSGGVRAQGQDGFPAVMSAANATPLAARTGGGPSAGENLQQWLYRRLLENGLRPDEAKGILAMNAKEGGATDAISLLGFVEGQPLPRLGPGAKATGPEGHLAGFMAQWNDLPMPGDGQTTAGRRGPGGSIPGVDASGKVTSWPAYLDWIRLKIVGQTGNPSDWQGNPQGSPQQYLADMTAALNTIQAQSWPNGNMPAGTGTGPRQANASDFGGVAPQNVESPLNPSSSLWDRYLNSTNLAAQGQKVLDLLSSDGEAPVDPNEGNWAKFWRIVAPDNKITMRNPQTGQLEEVEYQGGMAPIFPGAGFFRALLQRAGVRVAAEGAAEAGAVVAGTGAASARAAAAGTAGRGAPGAVIPGAGEAATAGGVIGTAESVTVPGAMGIAGIVERAAQPGVTARLGEIYTDIAQAMRTQSGLIMKTGGYGLDAAEQTALRSQVVSALGNPEITAASAKVLRDILPTLPARNAAGQFAPAAFDNMYIAIGDLLRKGSPEVNVAMQKFTELAKAQGILKDFSESTMQKLLTATVATLGIGAGSAAVYGVTSAEGRALQEGVDRLYPPPPPEPENKGATPLNTPGGGAPADPGVPPTPKVPEKPVVEDPGSAGKSDESPKMPSIYPPGYYERQGLPTPAAPAADPSAPVVPPAVPPPGTVLPPPAGPPPGSNPPPPPAAGGPVASGAPTGGPGTSGWMMDDGEKKYWTVEADGAIVWRGQNGNPTAPPDGQPGAAATTVATSAPAAAPPAPAAPAPAVPPPSEVLPPAAAPLAAEAPEPAAPAPPGSKTAPMPKSGTQSGYLPTPMQSSGVPEVLVPYLPDLPNYNPFTNPPPWAMTRQDWAQYGVDVQNFMGNLAQRDVDATSRATEIAKLNRTINEELIPTYERVAPAFEEMQASLATGMTPEAFANKSGKSVEMITQERNAAFNALDSAYRNLDKLESTDVIKDAEDIAAKQKPPPRPPDEDKFSKVRPDGIAEGLGKGFVKGIMQEFGLDGSVFESPLNWAFTKFFTGTLNAGMGLLDWKSRQVRDPQQQLVYADGTAATGQGSPFGPGTSPVLGFLQGILGVGPSNLYQNNLNPDGTQPGSAPQMSIGPSDPSGVASQMSPTTPLPAESPVMAAPAAYGGGMNINIQGGYTNMDEFNRNAAPGLTAVQERNSPATVAATAAPPSPVMQGI